MKNGLFIIALSLLLGACASPYPLGMNEEQWNALNPDERQTLLIQQQAYQEEQRLAQIKADAKARELQLQRDLIERQRLEKLYQHPQNGNVVMVNLLDGQFQSGKKTRRIVEASYQIARGETQQIDLLIEDPKKHYQSTETAYLTYEANGNGVYLSLDRSSYHHSKRIALLRDGDWACGSHYSKNLAGSYEQLKNVKLFVKEIGASCRHHRR